MARLNYSGIAITAGTGRLNSPMGGNVLLKNGVVRNYVTPVNPSSSDQVAVRNALSFLSSEWKNLSEVQRAAWEAARLQSEYFLPDTFSGTPRPASSGKLLFVQYNYNCTTMVGLPASVVLTEPTSLYSFEDIVIESVTAAAGTGAIGYTFTAASTDESALVVVASPSVSPGNMKKRKSLMRIVSQEITPASPVSIKAGYDAKFGGVGDAGTVIFVDIIQVAPAYGVRRLLHSARVVVSA